MSARALTLFGWLGFVVACLAVTLSTRVATDLQAFLPAAASPEQELIVDEIRAGAASGLIMIVAGSEDRPAEPGAVERLRDSLDASGRFRLVASRPDPRLLAAREPLFRHRYLLSDRLGPEPFSTEALHAHLSTLVERLVRGDPTLDESLAAADPTAEFHYLLGRWFGGAAATEDGTRGWRLGPGRAILLALADAAPYDLDAQSAALLTIEQHAQALDPALPVELAGAPAVATASRDAIRGEVVRVSTLAAAGMLLILLTALRSVRAATLALVPVLTGLLAGAAAVRLGFGELHGITLAFGVTLLGVTVDYPLHHFWHRRAHSSRATPIRRRLFISAMSTALGFAAMAVAGYPGLQQLALLSSTGIAVAAITTVWVLPALAGTSAARSVTARSAAGRPLPRWLPATVAAIVMLGGIGAAAGPLDLQTDIAAMSPLPPQIAQRDRALRDRLGLAEPRFVIPVSASSREATLRETEALTDMLRARPDQVDRFTAVTHLIPSARTQQQRARTLPDAERLRARLQAALDDLPLRPAAFAPFIDAVDSSGTLAPLMPEQLPPGLVRQRIDQRLKQRAERWISTVQLGGVAAPARLAQAVRDGGWRLVDLRAAAGDLVTSYQRQALGHFGLGAGVIALVILAGTRSLRRTASVLAVAGGGVGGALMVLAMLGMAVSVFHVVALLLVVGLGIDYALFARPGDPAGRGSVMICAASTVLTFGILATADIPLLRAIGITVACGTLTAWSLALLFARGERASSDVPAS